MNTSYQARLARVQAALAEREIDGLAVSQQFNRRYLSGYTARDGSGGESSGWLLITPRRAWLATTFLYLEQAEHETSGLEVVRVEASSAETVAKLIQDAGLRRVGFEEGDLTVAEHTTLADTSERELVAAGGIVERLRAVKDEAELASIRKAAALTDQAYAFALERLRPGVTERELAWAIEVFLRERGSDGLAFDVGVAFGPNTAIPHAHPSDRPIEPGDPYWIDLGARRDGYCADLTRSGYVRPRHGSLPEYEKLYGLALAAHAAAFERIRPGMTGQDADAVARAVITAGGFAEQFAHSLGHGVGLAVHEAPAVNKRNDDPLPAGAVLTIEPGIYLSGQYGVRIEDLAVLTEHGLEPLSHAPKQMMSAEEVRS